MTQNISILTTVKKSTQKNKIVVFGVKSACINEFIIVNILCLTLKFAQYFMFDFFTTEQYIFITTL